MPINYDELMALKNLGQEIRVYRREVMLYACGIGMGAGPHGRAGAGFRQRGRPPRRARLKVVPTFASVAAWGAGARRNESNRVMVVDGERDITFHKPLAVAAISPPIPAFSTFSTRARTRRRDPPQDGLKDEKGRAAGDAGCVAFARGDGGFGRAPPKASPNRTRFRPGPGQVNRYPDPPQSGAGLPALRRPHPAALRSRIRRRAGLRKADPARHVHLRTPAAGSCRLCRLRRWRLQQHVARFSSRSIPARP